jgi:hypothetical protein
LLVASAYAGLLVAVTENPLAAMLNEQLKLATPETTVTGPVPPAFVHDNVLEPGLAPSAKVTVVLLSSVMTLPKPSATPTANDVEAPAVTFAPDDGWVVNTNCDGASAVMVSCWVPEVSPEAAAVIVGVPALVSP